MMNTSSEREVYRGSSSWVPNGRLDAGVVVQLVRHLLPLDVSTCGCFHAFTHIPSTARREESRHVNGEGKRKGQCYALALLLFILLSCLIYRV